MLSYGQSENNIILSAFPRFAISLLDSPVIKFVGNIKLRVKVIPDPQKYNG
jgi:hypothetical protein